MGLKSWLYNSVGRVSEDGIDGIRRSIEILYPGIWNYYWNLRFKLGDGPTNVFERDWDVLIVLDGCRYDLLQDRSNPEFIQSINSICSVSSATPDWMQETFSPEYEEICGNTAYITGNPYSSRYITHDEFAAYEAVWEDAWDDKIGTVRPRRITDRVIDVWRKTDPNRLIAHYMQPHYPFLTDPQLHGGLDPEQFGEMSKDSVWERFRKGDINKERIWEAYRSNFDIIVQEVKFLTHCIDADSVVITADHGNAFGEFGEYGHPSGVWNPYVRRVPWWVTTASADRDYQPDTTATKLRGDIKGEQDETGAIEEKLKDLGYL